MAKKNQRKKINYGGGTGRVLLCLFGASAAARGQQVIAPPPSYFTPPPSVLEDQFSREGNIQSNPLANILPTFGDLLHIGPVNLDPHFGYTVTYGTGIQSTPGHQTATVVQQVSPGILFSMGSHFTLDYTPTFSFYSSRDLKDTIDHRLNFQWGTSYEDWILGVNQTYSQTDDPQVQTASQTALENYTTTLSASYRFNSKLSLSASVNQNIASSESFSNSKTWSTTEFLTYQFFPRLNAAIGGTIGYDEVESGTDIFTQSLLAQITMVIQDKLSLSANGGIEHDEFLGGRGSQLNPVFAITATYAPFVPTTIALSAQRSLTPAIFQSQAAETTSVGLSWSQRFFTHYNFFAGFTYETTHYETTTVQVVPTVILRPPPLPPVIFSSAVLPDRTDDYYVFNTGVNWQFLKRANGSVNYQYSQNTSGSGAAYSFSSSQISAQLGYRF